MKRPPLHLRQELVVYVGSVYGDAWPCTQFATVVGRPASGTVQYVKNNGKKVREMILTDFIKNWPTRI